MLQTGDTLAESVLFFPSLYRSVIIQPFPSKKQMNKMTTSGRRSQLDNDTGKLTVREYLLPSKYSGVRSLPKAKT